MLIDGKKIAAEIQAEIAEKVSGLKERKPGLSLVLVGDHPASLSYVKAKKKVCAAVGINSTILELPSSIAERDLIQVIEALNHDPTVDGILVQLPLPKHIDEKLITAAIYPNKDVDGFHPINVGKMLLGEEDGFLPCTPYGIQVLLQRSQIPVEGKHVVILGRSNIVGKPLAAILMQRKPHCNATVTIAHSKSERLIELTRSADILVAAIGQPQFVKKEMVQKGATVIDVGINRLPNGKLVGDVDFEEVSTSCSHITPVPGGVGPMTIAMLLKNTLSSFLKAMLFLLLMVSCTQQKDPCTYFEGKAMTLPYHITIGKKLNRKEQKQVLQVIESTFSQVHAIFDNWNPRSEISLLNQTEKEAFIPLSAELQDLLHLCGQIVSLSQGRFDPTVGSLVSLWHNHPSPPTEAFQKACDGLGWNHISIQNGIFKKDSNETKIDLCGISKGICIDWMVERLQKIGLTDLIVDWGGEMRAIGHHPELKDWLVQIHPALTQNHRQIAPIPLRNSAIACSHNPCIINPLTASPIEQTDYAVAYVAVIAPNCALADALATAAQLFPSRKEAEKWAQEVVELYPDVRFWILSHI
jgi:methylenetetrahydrofolate dehydrogenase (NADP+)/methenyltetrahydrofolate cyclohydrolase